MRIFTIIKLLIQVIFVCSGALCQQSSIRAWLLFRLFSCYRCIFRFCIWLSRLLWLSWNLSISWFLTTIPFKRKSIIICRSIVISKFVYQVVLFSALRCIQLRTWWCLCSDLLRNLLIEKLWFTILFFHSLNIIVEL